MTTMKTTCAAALLLACALAAGGCSEGDKPCWDCPAEPMAYPLASTPDQLALNTSRCFGEMNYDEFVIATDGSFTLPLNQVAVNRYDWPRAEMSYHEVAGAVANLFSGEVVTREDGQVIQAARDVAIRVFYPEADWADTTLGQPAEPAKWAPFRIDAIVEQSWGTLHVAGILDIFAKAWQPPSDSGLDPHWVLVRIVDMTTPSGGKRAAEYTSWSELMTMYATGPDTVAAGS